MSVQGIEITEDVNERGRQAGLPANGRPPRPRVALRRERDGVGARAGQRLQANDARSKRLMGATRTIVVPVVNPEGFNTSREAGAGGRRRQRARGHRHRRDGQPAGPVRVPAQELPREQHPDGHRSRRGRLHPAGQPNSAWRSSASTPTATTAASGAAPARRPTARRPRRRLRAGLPRQRARSPSPRRATSATWSPSAR